MGPILPVELAQRRAELIDLSQELLFVVVLLEPIVDGVGGRGLRCLVAGDHIATGAEGGTPAHRADVKSAFGRAAHGSPLISVASLVGDYSPFDEIYH
jgi:hypothetical protein